MSSTALEVPLVEPTIVVVPWHDEVVDRTPRSDRFDRNMSRDDD